MINVLKAFLFVALVSYTFYKSLIIVFILIPLVIIFPFFLKKELAKKRRNMLLIEFREMINILMSYLDAGYSIDNSFVATKKDIDKLYKGESLIGNELSYICKYIAINKPIEIPLKEFAYRSGNDDIVDFSETFILAKKSGGTLHKIINNTIKTIRDKIQISMDIQAKTSQKRFEQNIMNVIPFLIILYLNLTSKGFLDPMYTTIVGRIIMTLLLILYIIAFKLAEHILNIEV